MEGLVIAAALVMVWHTPASLPATPTSGKVFQIALSRFDPTDRRPGTLQAPESAPMPALRPTVTQTRQKDSVGNGIAIGATIGGGAAFAMITTMYARCDAGCEAPAFSSLGVPVTAFGAGVGALVGYLIDRAR